MNNSAPLWLKLSNEASLMRLHIPLSFDIANRYNDYGSVDCMIYGTSEHIVDIKVIGMR